MPIKRTDMLFDTFSFMADVTLVIKTERTVMKLALFLLIGLAAAAAAQAQTTNTPARSDPNFESRAVRRAHQNPPVVREVKPNEVLLGRFSADGIFVQAAKNPNRNILQLLNPLAPAEYGSAMDNTVRDPILDQPSGLKFFRLKF
jgi:hypothetical protein